MKGKLALLIPPPHHQDFLHRAIKRISKKTGIQPCARCGVEVVMRRITTYRLDLHYNIICYRCEKREEKP